MVDDQWLIKDKKQTNKQTKISYWKIMTFYCLFVFLNQKTRNIKYSIYIDFILLIQNIRSDQFFQTAKQRNNIT